MLIPDVADGHREIVAVHLRQRGLGEGEINLVVGGGEVEIGVIQAQPGGAGLQGRCIVGLSYCRYFLSIYDYRILNNAQARRALSEVVKGELCYDVGLLGAVCALHWEVAFQAGIAVVHTLIHALADELSVKGCIPDAYLVNVANEVVGGGIVSLQHAAHSEVA